MASLREIKDRIGSVKSTLKITSAMKLVASSKLRKSQKAIENMLPYRKALEEILSEVRTGTGNDLCRPSEGGKLAIVAVASNSSLCGAFNVNVAKAAIALASAGENSCIIAIGRKMADAARRAGFAQEEDLSQLIGKPSPDSASVFADKLAARFRSGEFSKVVFVYNHFASTARQEVVEEQYLPLEHSGGQEDGCASSDEYILEPSAAGIEETLLPQVLGLKVYSVLLDSAAAEHAARTVAMQTATDNAQDILSELTLEYNKGRQQKITAEILDLVGGMTK